MARLVENFDLRGAFNYLVEDPDEGGMGLTRPQAENQIARRLAKETSFDIDSALKEGYNNNQIISKLTGIEPRAGLSVFGEGVVRGAIEETPEALGFAYGVKPGAALAAKLPIPHPVARGLTVAAGGLLGGISTMLGMSYLDAASGASEKIGDLVLGEKEDILPEDQPWREAGETTGLFLSFSGALRGPLRRLGKEPDIPISPGVALVGEEKAIDLGARKLLNNIANLNKKPGIGERIGARTLGGIERTLETMGRGAREPGFWRREASLSTRGGIGAGVAEQIDPGDAGSAFFGTLIGLTMPYGLVAAGLTGAWGKVKGLWSGFEAARKKKAQTQLGTIFEDTKAKLEARVAAEKAAVEEAGGIYEGKETFEEIEQHHLAALYETFFKSDRYGKYLSPALVPDIGERPLWSLEKLPITIATARKIADDPNFLKYINEEEQKYLRFSYELVEDSVLPGNEWLLPAFAEVQGKEINYALGEKLQGKFNEVARLVDYGILEKRISPAAGSRIIMDTLAKEIKNRKEVETLLWKDKAKGGFLDYNQEITLRKFIEKWDKLNEMGHLTGRATPEDVISGDIADIAAEIGVMAAKPTLPFIELKRKYQPRVESNIPKGTFGYGMTQDLKKDLNTRKIFLTDEQVSHLQMYIVGSNDRKKIGMVNYKDLAKEARKNLKSVEKRGGLQRQKDYYLEEARKYDKLAKQYPINKYSQKALFNSFTDALPSAVQPVPIGTAIRLRSALSELRVAPGLKTKQRHVINELLGGKDATALEADLMAHALKNKDTSLIEAINYSRAANEVFTKSLGADVIQKEMFHSDPEVRKGDLLAGRLLSGEVERAGKRIKDLTRMATFNESQYLNLAEIAASGEDPAKKELLELMDKFAPHMGGEFDVSRKLGEGNPSKKTIEESVAGILRDMVGKGVINLTEQPSFLSSPVIAAATKLPGERTTDPLRDLGKDVVSSINPTMLNRYIQRLGVFAKDNPYVETLLNDLQEVATQQNTLKLFLKDKGMLYKLGRDKQQIATVLDYDSPVLGILETHRGKRPVKAENERITLLKSMKFRPGDVKVKNFKTGQMESVSNLYPSALDGYKSSHLGVAIETARESQETFVQQLDPSTRPIPFINANKVYDYFFETGNVVEGWTGPSLIDLWLKRGIITPKEATHWKKVMGKMDEVQTSLDFTKGLGAQLKTEELSKSQLARYVARFWGAQGGAFLGRSAGYSTIQIPGMGATVAENIFVNAPESAMITLMGDILNPGNAESFIDFLKTSPKSQANAKVEARSWMEKSEFMQEAFPAPIGKSPFLAGAVSDYLTEESPREVIPPPPPPLPTTNIGMSPSSPAVSGMQQNVGQQPVTNQRARYAAMFPFDPASEVVRERQAQGIGSLAVP